jgi:hypothetical protein
MGTPYDAVEPILAEARKLARVTLSSEYEFSFDDLLDVQAVLDEAISALYKAGQRSPEALTRYAIHKVVIKHRRDRELPQG